MIEDAVILPDMTDEIVRIPDRLDAERRNKVFRNLFDDHVDSVIARERRKQCGAIMGNSGFERRKRRNISEARKRGWCFRRASAELFPLRAQKFKNATCGTRFPM